MFRTRTVLTSVVSVLATAALVTPALSAEPDPASFSAVPVTKEKVDAAIADLDARVATVMRDTGIPGMAVSVVYQGVPVYQKGFGVTEVGTDNRVDAETAFQVASVSKSVSTSVVAAAMKGGSLSWDDRAARLLPQFRLSNRWVTRHTTIGDLFAMRTGLPHQAGDDLEELGYSRMQIIKRFHLLPLEPFRNQSLYTNFGLTAGAQAVARAKGVAWEDLAARRVYTPLGMSRTTSRYKEFMQQTNRATLHVQSEGQWVPTGNRKEQAQAPAGQVSTTANDFARWMIMWLQNGQYEGKQIVDAAALAQARTPRILTALPAGPTDRPSFYGYGIGLRTDSTGRVREGFSGAFSQGAAAHFTLLPAEELGIAVFTNAFPIGAAEGLAYTFLDRAELGENPIDWMTVWEAYLAAALQPEPGPFDTDLPRQTGKPAASLRSYAGTFRSDYYGRLTLKQIKGGLLATIGPKRVEFLLTPYGGNVFAMQGSSVPAARFSRANGEVRTVELAALQAPGNAVFRRVR